MADPTTELAKEFLEINNYLVRKETKFYKNKNLIGTPSDIDIIATSSKGIKIGDLELKKDVVAEVKNWQVNYKEDVDNIYKKKFRYIDKSEISWKQLKKYISSKRFDKVLFCQATTEDVCKYALKEYGIKVITAGFIIKSIANLIKRSEKRWSYYPEWYHYNTIRTILLYLYYSKFKDKLTLEDLVWIDPKKDSQYRNQFAKLNAEFMENFVYYESYAKILIKLISKLSKKHPWWFKKQLKSNKNFWAYLTKNKK